MSMRYQAGIMTASYFPLKVPNRPTGATATLASGTSVSVAFTAPTDIGGGAITGYTVVSSGGQIATGASSPVTVTGLTTGVAYTFVVYANNAFGNSPASAASNSVTPIAQGQQAFTTAGTFSWVAPASVTSVSVIAVGAGGNGGSNIGGAGGALGYKNNITVTPGNSYTVVVAAASSGSGTSSYFINTGTVNAPSGGNSSTSQSANYTGDGGGRGGSGGAFPNGGGGGAGGYSGNGGNGGNGQGSSGSAGSGGGGGGGNGTTDSSLYLGSGAGGVGLLGQGSSGTGGDGGTGGSGGANGQPASFGSPSGGGGIYGGGAGGGSTGGTVGAVRIIWPGTTRQFPSTNTGNV